MKVVCIMVDHQFHYVQLTIICRYDFVLLNYMHHDILLTRL